MGGSGILIYTTRFMDGCQEVMVQSISDSTRKIEEKLFLVLYHLPPSPTISSFLVETTSL